MTQSNTAPINESKIESRYKLKNYRQKYKGLKMLRLVQNHTGIGAHSNPMQWRTLVRVWSDQKFFKKTANFERIEPQI